MKSALTFAEIFIVMALIFIIQTVANFGLSDDAVPSMEIAGRPGGAASETPDRVTLSLRQVPSGSDPTDHLSYLIFSGGGGTGEDLVVELRESGQDSGLYARTRAALGMVSEPESCAYFVSGAAPGSCVRRSCSGPSAEASYVWAWWEEAERELFISELLERFGMSMLAIPVAGGQPEYLLSWSPREVADLAPSGVEVRLGLGLCLLEVRDDTRRVDPAWQRELELEVGDEGLLDYPHPLIVSRREYRRNGTEARIRPEFGHVTMLGRDRDEWPPGFVFASSAESCLGDPFRLREVAVAVTED